MSLGNGIECSDSSSTFTQSEGFHNYTKPHKYHKFALFKIKFTKKDVLNALKKMFVRVQTVTVFCPCL